MRWITKFFTGEKPKEKRHVVSVQEFDSWFGERVSAKLELVQNDVNNILAALRQDIQLTREKLGRLESAQLQNPNIPMRAKQFMEGNRQAYIRAVRQFLPSVEIGELDSLQISSFAKQAKQKFERLADNTQKPYTVLQEFFANESGAVARSLKIILATVNKLEEKYQNEGLAGIQELGHAIAGINSKISQKETLGKSIAQLSSEIASLNSTVEKLAAEKEALLKSEQYKKYASLKHDKSGMQQQLKAHEQSFLDHFQALEPALKRFAKISANEERIAKYLAHPVAALMDDSSFEILPVLESLAKNISSNAVQLNDRKERKTLEKLQFFSHSFLEDFKAKRASIVENIRETSSSLDATRIESTLSEHNQKLTEEQYRLENKMQHLSSARKELEKIDIGKMSLDLSGRLSEFLNEPVSITL